MIRAFIWKEWREQRIVALAVLLFGALAMYLTAQFVEQSSGATLDSGGARELMAIALAYLAGAVSGAILLADEKEVGTLEFLDTLPSRRRNVWVGKVIAGALLAVGQCVVLALVAIATECIDERTGPAPYGVLIIFVGLMSFAWGMFGGSLSRSTLGAVFQGSIACFTTGIVLVILFVGLFGPRTFSRGPSLHVLVFYASWVGLGLLGSAYFFTTVDRRRVPHKRRPGAEAMTVRKPWFAGTRALAWLSTRQAVYVAMGALAVGLLLGSIMLVPESYPLFVWPGATLTLGVLAGVTTLGEEQVRGVARFWAERRLPLGRLWLVKTGIHFAIGACGALVLFLLIVAASPGLLFRSRLILELRPELWRFLFLTLVYGFTIGHLSGMLFRKTVVAGLVATVCSAALTGLIFPSIIGGGAAWWQVWAPAAVLLATARLLLYPWATDRISMRGPVLRVVGGGVLALGIVGIGIVYRVVEIPLAPDRLEESGYVEALPTKEADDSGRRVKAAASQYRKAAEEARADYPNPNGLPALAKQGNLTADSTDPLTRVARIGWTTDAVPLARWLDRVFAADWLKSLDEAGNGPIGLFEDPRDLHFYDSLESIGQLREMSHALLARGLQRQQAGDDATYCQLLRGGLAAARTARNGGGRDCAVAGLECEEILLGGLSDWLKHCHCPPELLRTLLAELARHEREMPVNATDVQWAEQVILRNTLERLSSWLPTQLGDRAAVIENRDPKADAEANLISFAWTVPWERARRERLVRFQSVEPVNPGWLSGLHRPGRWGRDRVDRIGALDRRGLATRRMARIEVALRLFEMEHQRAASELTELTPAYLAEIPLDPYTGAAFTYRISDGTLVSSRGWSIGRDRRLAAMLVAALAQPMGGVNGPWIPAALDVPTRPAVIGPSPTFVPVIRTIPKGYAILKANGPIGARTGIVPPPATSGDDGLVIIPPTTAITK
jgi:ABC-2 family transporter protein